MLLITYLNKFKCGKKHNLELLEKSPKSLSYLFIYFSWPLHVWVDTCKCWCFGHIIRTYTCPHTNFPSCKVELFAGQAWHDTLLLWSPLYRLLVSPWWSCNCYFNTKQAVWAHVTVHLCCCISPAAARRVQILSAWKFGSRWVMLVLSVILRDFKKFCVT